jgi:hypothetical protein
MRIVVSIIEMKQIDKEFSYLDLFGSKEKLTLKENLHWGFSKIGIKSLFPTFLQKMNLRLQN